MLVRQRILEERKKLRISSTELAKMLNVNKGTVSRWESGDIKSIPPDTIKQLAEIFDLSLADFIDTDMGYYYMLSDDINKKHSSSFELSEDENAMIVWYRHLSLKEKKLIKKLWQPS